MDKAKKEEFKGEILKTVIDKLLIALLIVMAGCVANQVVEKTKSQLALARVVSEKRIDALATSWNHVYSMEVRLRGYDLNLTNEAPEFERASRPGRDAVRRILLDALRVARTRQDTQAAIERFDSDRRSFVLAIARDLADKQGSEARSALAFIDSTRFWLSEDDRTKLVAFIEAVTQYMDSASVASEADRGRLRAALERKREGILEVQRRIVGR